MAKSILEIVMQTIKQGQGGKQAAAELRELKGTVGEVSQGLLGFNLGTLSAAGAVIAVSSAVAGAVTDYQAYAESIRGMAAITGTGVEETSRLVQAFDDLGIAQDQVQTVMEGAAKKGFVASIENIANLADQYNELSTQEEKNKLLTDKLGKSGLDMAKAFEQGGAAIREAAAAQADGMIVTEENIRAAEELRVAQDNLNDSWMALSNTVAKFAVPAMASMIDAVNLYIQSAGNLQRAQAGVGGASFAVAISQQMEAESNQNVAEAATRNYTAMAKLYAQNTSIVPVLNQVASGWNALPPAMQTYITKADEAAAATEKMKKPIEDVQAALEDLEAAKNSFSQGLAGQISSQLEAAGLSESQLNQALAAVDAQLGSTTLQQQQMQDWIANAVARYQGGAGLGEFQNVLGQIQRAFMSSDPGVASATNALQQSATAMISIGNIYVGNEMDYQTLLARLRVDLPGLLG